MRLLLVEDDLQLGRALSTALGEAGFSTTWVRRLAEARAFSDEGGFDALLLDLGLPDGEGFALIEELRGAGSRLPIVVITARDHLQDKLRGLQLGADDYVLKPFAVPELVARVFAVLRRSSGFACSVWRVGALGIDVEQQRVSLDERALELTVREYQLLVELARHAGRVVPKNRLMERVWGRDKESSENTLEFFVHCLRKKLPADTIHTVRGVGYFLSA